MEGFVWYRYSRGGASRCTRHQAAASPTCWNPTGRRWCCWNSCWIAAAPRSIRSVTGRPRRIWNASPRPHWTSSACRYGKNPMKNPKEILRRSFTVMAFYKSCFQYLQIVQESCNNPWRIVKESFTGATFSGFYCWKSWRILWRSCTV